MSRRTALVLLGHGSHLNADSSAPVYEHAARIRASGRFDEVLEAFWKEEPSLRDALALVDADDVVVVPLFLAEGYFTREVLPRELGIAGALTVRGSQRIHYCAPVGTHRSMAEMIVSRASEAFGGDADHRNRAALVIIGHGTERSETSGDTVYALVDRIRALGEFGTVACGFLDESPEIGEVLAQVDAEDVVLVPFFVAEGWHTRETIPADLGLGGEVTRRGGQTIWYTPPVGTMPGVAEVVMEIAEEALGEGERGRGGEGDDKYGEGERGRGGEGDDETGSAAPPIRLAREAFFAWVDAVTGGSRDFLQLRIEREAPPRHSRESGNPGRLAGNVEARYSLRPIPVVPGRPERGEGSAPGGEEGRTGGREENPPLRHSRFRENDGLVDLRDRALAIARYTDAGAYRPLRTASDLRGGWSFTGLTVDELWQVISVIYPGAVLHWYFGTTGISATVDYRRWADRQTAMYAVLRDLADEQVAEVIRSTCGRCLRHRLWQIDSGLRVAAEAISWTVPCREPCTIFATESRKMAAPP